MALLELIDSNELCYVDVNAPLSLHIDDNWKVDEQEKKTEYKPLYLTGVPGLKDPDDLKLYSYYDVIERLRHLPSTLVMAALRRGYRMGYFKAHENAKYSENNIKLVEDLAERLKPLRTW